MVFCHFPSQFNSLKLRKRSITTWTLTCSCLPHSHLISAASLVRKQLHVMYTSHNVRQRGTEKEGRRDLRKGADWRGVGLPDAPAPVFVCACVCVCCCALEMTVSRRCLWEWGERGVMFPKGGPVCYQREVEIYYPTQSKCLTGALTHTHAVIHTTSHTHTNTHTLRHTNSPQETLSHNAKAPLSRRVHCSNQVGYGAALIVR